MTNQPWDNDTEPYAPFAPLNDAPTEPLARVRPQRRRHGWAITTLVTGACALVGTVVLVSIANGATPPTASQTYPVETVAPIVVTLPAGLSPTLNVVTAPPIVIVAATPSRVVTHRADPVTVTPVVTTTLPTPPVAISSSSLPTPTLTPTPTETAPSDGQTANGTVS